jgi:hypothetical protein
MTEHSFEVGERVTWLQERHGGYRFNASHQCRIDPIAGIVQEITAQRVKIRIAQRVGPAWLPRIVAVKPEKLRPRVNPVAALGETEEKAP